MAKKKIEDQHDEDLDDDKELNEGAEDEEEDEEEGEEEGTADDKGESAEEEDSSEEDDEDSGLKKKESEAEREAIRERRRREKKMKRERDRREKAMMHNTIVTMAEEIKKLKDGQGDVHKKFDGLTQQQIQTEVSELTKVYNQAQAIMEQAISDGDGKRFSQAKALSDKAWARYTFLETQKRQRPESTSDDKQERIESVTSRTEAKQTDDGSSEGVQLGSEGKRLGIAFVNRHKSWYDPNGNNRDSKIVMTIDADLYKEGYDPESKDYWEELEDRCKEYLPHRFKKSADAKKPRSIVGGNGNESSPSGGAEKSLPKEFVQTLKAAGYWEDPVKRKAAIKNYYANKSK